MQPNTRQSFNELINNIASYHNVENVVEEFIVQPSIAQQITDKVVEQSDFLSKINHFYVTEKSGEKIGIGSSNLIAGRIDTNTATREGKTLVASENNKYNCEETFYDTAIKYATLDAWAKFPDFFDRYRAAIQKNIALNRQLIGFNGESVATTTNSTTNTKLQDVNIGWLKHIKTNKPSNFLTEGSIAGKIRIGEGGDFKNLDQLVFDVSNLIDDEYQGSELIAIVGSQLVVKDRFKVYDLADDAKNKNEILKLVSSDLTYGGLKSYTVPGFPDKGLLITSFDNLSIYYQDSSLRKRIEDTPSRSRIIDYLSVNECYVIEQYGKSAAIDSTVVEYI